MTRTLGHLMRAALRQMWRFRLRSTLIVACAALGVAGAVTSVNYVSGGRRQVLEQIQRLGTNVIVVSAQQSRSVAGRARTGSIVTTLRDEDYLALRREVDGLVRSSATYSLGLRIKAGDLSRTAPVVGVEPDYFAIKSWRASAGEPFDVADARRGARVVLLGSQLAHDLYGDTDPVGERMQVNRVPFEVVGVLAERGQGVDVTNEDAQAYVPLPTAMHRLASVDYYGAIVLEVADWTQMDRIGAAVARVMRERHRVSESHPADFRVQNQKELIDTQAVATARLGFFVRLIGFAALVVSGLGVLAIAWISVRDRIREIGTRRALGATAPQVFFQFAFEATVLSAVGAGAGLLLGWVGSALAAGRGQLPFVFEPGAAVLALALAMLLNLAFASWPALRAARLDPIVALRHE